MQGYCGGRTVCAEKKGFPPIDLETGKKFIGPPLRQTFMAHCGVDDIEAESMVSMYREYYTEVGLRQCKPYNGIRELLEHLCGEGRKLYVATAKPTDYSKTMLEEWDLSKYFIEIFGASFDKSFDTKDKIIKLALEKENTKDAIMVGDTHYDIEGARANSINSAGVFYGFGERERILEAKPNFTAETVAHIMGDYAGVQDFYQCKPCHEFSR